MLINLFGVFFHLFEIPLLVFLLCAVALQYVYSDMTIRLSNGIRVLWMFIFLYLYICAILLSSINAIEVSIVFKSTVKWVEVSLTSLLLLIYLSNMKRFKIIYWTLFASAFLFILVRLIDIIYGRVNFFTYRIFPGIEAVFCVALLMPFLKNRWKWLYFLFFVSMVSSILSLSRTAWLALAVCLGGYLSIQRSLRGLVYVLAGALAILGMIYLGGRELLTYRVGELASGTSGSNVERVALLHVAFRAIADHPFIGVGSLNFSRYMVKEGMLEGIISPNLDTLGPHNAFLQVASEEGLLGLLFFSLVIYFVLRLLIDAFKYSSVERQYLYGLCFFFIVTLFNLTFGFIAAHFRYFLALLIGMAAATMRLPFQAQQKAEQ